MKEPETMHEAVENFQESCKEFMNEVAKTKGIKASKRIMKRLLKGIKFTYKEDV